MNHKFENLAQANKDHYDEHPTSHAAIMAVCAVGAIVGIRKLQRKFIEAELKNARKK